MTQATEQPNVIRIGPDRVTISDNEVVIEAKHPMPDWKVWELNPPPVYFQDAKYHLIESRKLTGPYAMRYVLVPWPAGLSSNSKNFYYYDAEAVTDRDGNLRTGRMDEVIRAMLMPLYPLLGLCWSGTQNRLKRFGFVPHAISGFSIFTVFCACFGQGVFAVVTINASLRTSRLVVGGFLRALSSDGILHLGPVGVPLAWLDCILTLAFMVDVAMRYSYYLRESEWSGGFLEWIFRGDGSENRRETV